MGGLDLGLEAGEEGRDAGIHGFTSLAETARLDEMRQGGAGRVVVGVSDTR